MNFFSLIKKSIYEPEFYAQISKSSTGKAIGYFSLLILLITLLQTVVPGWLLTTTAEKGVRQFVNNALNEYPADLRVRITNGVVSTNVTEPYIIPLDNSAPEDNPEIKNLIVIDTTTPFSASQFNNYQTIAWLTKDSIFVRDNNGQFRTIDLSKVSHFVLDKAVLVKLVQKIDPWFKFIAPVGIFFIILGIYIGCLFRLVYAFFLALCIFFLTKLMKKSQTYGNSYRIALYAMTLGLFVETILGWTNISGFPFMFTLIALVIVFINLKTNTPLTPAKTAATKKA